MTVLILVFISFFGPGTFNFYFVVIFGISIVVVVNINFDILEGSLCILVNKTSLCPAHGWLVCFVFFRFIFFLIFVSWVVNNGAGDCLERTISEMTWYVSSWL